MKPEKNNEIIRIILFARPADSLNSRAGKFFLHRHEDFSVCTNLYELALKLESDSASILTILITRPSMITKQIGDYLKSYRTDLCLIGWLDPQESPSDTAFTFAADLLIMMLSEFDQLKNFLKVICRIVDRDVNVARSIDLQQPPLSQPIRDLLNDEELTAILGMP